MISISRAQSPEDFAIAASFCDALAEWDASQGQSYGLSPDSVLRLFHGETSDTLARKYKKQDAAMFIARRAEAPAGCIALDAFDDNTAEIHRFYVDPRYRGKGIGGALMQTALTTIQEGERRKVVVNTTVYMRDAIAIYESFAFLRCQAFRSVPENMTHTELFMARTI